MSLASYIFKGAICAVAGVAIGEALIIGVDTIKVRKAYIKALKEDPQVPEDQLDEVKKSGRIWIDSIKVAAKKRVEEMKKDPAAEICALWGCTTYLIGNWQGHWRGFISGWDIGKDDSDTLINIMKRYAPTEFNTMLEKIRNVGPDSVLLSHFVHKDKLYSSSWVPSECKLAEVVDTIAKEVSV